MINLKAVQGPYHIGFGISFAVHGETVTIVASSKDMAEALATYLTDRVQYHEAKPMIAGAQVKYEDAP